MRTVRTRRGVVPATGYFEWQVGPDGKKRPLFIHDGRGAPLALAALWDRWHGPDGALIESFAVITRAASGFLEAIHNRMPFELRSADVERWLSPEAATAEQLADVLGCEPDVAHLTSHPVSALANSPKNDGPECIAEAQDSPEPRRLQRQLDLFESLAAAPSRARSGSRTR